MYSRFRIDENPIMDGKHSVWFEMNLHKSNHTEIEDLNEIKEAERERKRMEGNQASGKCDLILSETHFSSYHRPDDDKIPSRFKFCWHVFKKSFYLGVTISSTRPRKTHQKLARSLTLHRTYSIRDPNLIFRSHILWPFTKRNFHYLINISQCYIININNQVASPTHVTLA